MGYVIGAVVLALIVWALSSERGLTEDERQRLTARGIFAQAPGTRGPHDPMGLSFEPAFVLRPSRAAEVLGENRAAELMKRGWLFWARRSDGG
jgi:hypothetical protein